MKEPYRKGVANRLASSLAASWRMASTAMRLVILAACADTFYVLIDGRPFEPHLP